MILFIDRILAWFITGCSLAFIVYFGQPFFYKHGEDYFIDGSGNLPFKIRHYLHETYCMNGRQIINDNGVMVIADPYFDTSREKWRAMNPERQADLKHVFEKLQWDETQRRILALKSEAVFYDDPFLVQAVKYHRDNMIQRFYIDGKNIVVDVRYNMFCDTRTNVCERLGM